MASTEAHGLTRLTVNDGAPQQGEPPVPGVIDAPEAAIDTGAPQIGDDLAEVSSALEDHHDDQTVTANLETGDAVMEALAG